MTNGNLGSEPEAISELEGSVTPIDKSHVASKDGRIMIIATRYSSSNIQDSSIPESATRYAKFYLNGNEVTNVISFVSNYWTTNSGGGTKVYYCLMNVKKGDTVRVNIRINVPSSTNIANSRAYYI